MREIKFRVWDKKKNRWFHGSTDPERIATSTDAINLFGEVITFGELMVDQNNEEAVSLDRLNDLVVLQYTGLKDKNGVEIYEGDIVQALEETELDDYLVNYEIRWDEQTARFIVGDHKGWEMEEADELEVIGNIYENPELLNE